MIFSKKVPSSQNDITSGLKPKLKIPVLPLNIYATISYIAKNGRTSDSIRYEQVSQTGNIEGGL